MRCSFVTRGPADETGKAFSPGNIWTACAASPPSSSTLDNMLRHRRADRTRRATRRTASCGRRSRPCRSSVPRAIWTAGTKVHHSPQGCVQTPPTPSCRKRQPQIRPRDRNRAFFLRRDFDTPAGYLTPPWRRNWKAAIWSMRRRPRACAGSLDCWRAARPDGLRVNARSDQG